LAPQQAGLPFARRPQVWEVPALTDLKLPTGGVDWPELLAPQQATTPLVRTAHV
jgi:hypothetical protein